MKRTLKRGLKVLEIVKGEANIAVEFASAQIAQVNGGLYDSRVTECHSMPSAMKRFSELLQVTWTYFLAAMSLSCFKVPVFDAFCDNPRFEFTILKLS